MRTIPRHVYASIINQRDVVFLHNAICVCVHSVRRCAVYSKVFVSHKTEEEVLDGGRAKCLFSLLILPIELCRREHQINDGSFTHMLCVKNLGACMGNGQHYK